MPPAASNLPNRPLAARTGLVLAAGVVAWGVVESGAAESWGGFRLAYWRCGGFRKAIGPFCCGFGEERGMGVPAGVKLLKTFSWFLGSPDHSLKPAAAGVGGGGIAGGGS